MAGVCGAISLGLPTHHARLGVAMGLAAAAAAAGERTQVWASGLAVVIVGLGSLPDPNASPADTQARRALLHVAFAAFVLGVALAVKQGIAARVLPSAAEGSAPVIVIAAAVALSAAVGSALPSPGDASMAEDARGVSVHGPSPRSLVSRFGAFTLGPGPLALALLLIGCGAVGRLARLPQLPAAARLAAAIPLDAVPLVIDRVVEESTDDPSTLRAAIQAAPDHDAAPLALGWPAALEGGWRPQRADGVEVEVARALERAGRGGEAIRLLAKHPRVGEVDALRTLFERTQGLPEDWRGGRLGREIEAHTGSLLDESFVFMHNESREIEFTTLAEAFDAWLVLGCDGAAFEGQPELTLALNAQPPWVVDCPNESARTQIWLQPGPHRLRIAFANDRQGPGGDRNATVTTLMVLPFTGL